jgi:Rrf2 family protein
MLMYLAEHPDKVSSVREIAEHKSVPYAFARSIQRDLIEAGMVVTKLGASGGAVLARDPADINLFEVITAIQGEPSAAVCKKNPDWCPQIEHCSAHPVWMELDRQIREFLESRTIADVV